MLRLVIRGEVGIAFAIIALVGLISVHGCNVAWSSRFSWDLADALTSRLKGCGFGVSVLESARGIVTIDKISQLSIEKFCEKLFDAAREVRNYHTVDDSLSHVCGYSDIWFRGQDDAQYQLLTSVKRDVVPSEASKTLQVRYVGGRVPKEIITKLRQMAEPWSYSVVEAVTKFLLPEEIRRHNLRQKISMEGLYSGSMIESNHVSYLFRNMALYAEELADKDSVSKLSYLQHQGVSTSVLNWTKNVEIALYYAVFKFFKASKRGIGVNDGATASLFVLDPCGLNEQYRLSKYIGIRNGKLSFPHNLDPMIRACSVLTRSYFELICKKEVLEAAAEEGIAFETEDELVLKFLRKDDCDRLKEKYRMDAKRLISETLPNPVAVLPLWRQNNARIRMLQNVFTIDGIAIAAAQYTLSHKDRHHENLLLKTGFKSPFADHVLKIDFDANMIRNIIAKYENSVIWKQVQGLESSEEYARFKRLSEVLKEVKFHGRHSCKK